MRKYLLIFTMLLYPICAEAGFITWATAASANGKAQRANEKLDNLEPRISALEQDVKKIIQILESNQPPIN